MTAPAGDRFDPGLGGFDPQRTYSAAAADYVRASRTYWQFLSTSAVEHADVQRGAAVLDVACGTGPSAIACAARTGPAGRVVGVDYAEGMLAIARAEADARGLSHVTFTQADLRMLPYRDEFDVVLCVLGIFFPDDMVGAARALWSHVRPGGRLVVAVFGGDVWTPMLEHFLAEVDRLRPDVERVLPWRRTEDPAVLARTLHDGGVGEIRLSTRTDEIPFVPEDWRTIVMGSGLRRIADDLGPQRDDVLARCEGWAREQLLTAVRVSSIYAVALKPA